MEKSNLKKGKKKKFVKIKFYHLTREQRVKRQILISIEESWMSRYLHETNPKGLNKW